MMTELRVPLRTLRLWLFVLVALSVFHLPIYPIEGESIGLYDLYLIVLFLMLLLTAGVDLPGTSLKVFLLSFSLWCCWLILQTTRALSARSMLVLIKNVQFLLGVVTTSTIVSRLLRRGASLGSIFESIDLVFLLLALFQLFSVVEQYFGLTGIPPGFGLGDWYRASLPFKDGVSPNPAGFVGGAYLLSRTVVYPETKTRFRNLAVSISAIVLLLTVSRTNIIAFVFVLGVRATLRTLNAPGRLLSAIATIAVVLVIGMVVLQFVPRSSTLWYLLKILEDPRELFQDRSFTIRYSSLWVSQIRAWTQSPVTVFTGQGTDYFRFLDGTYTGILATQGVIGAVLFFTAWFGAPVVEQRKPAVRWMVLFLAVNAINAETLISSYRAVQALVVVLVPVLVCAAMQGSGRESAHE